MKDIFEFNHIDKKLSESDIQTKLCWRFRGKYWKSKEL